MGITRIEELPLTLPPSGREVDFAKQKTEGESESSLYLTVADTNKSYTQAPSPDFVGSSLPEGAYEQENAITFSFYRLRLLMFCHPFRNFTL
jgi:hypothetical protein